MAPVISVKNLKKYYDVFEKEPGILGSVRSLWKRKYETVRAVDEVSFSIDEGELVGFIGPNGAGKTTTIKVLSGLLYPTSGKVDVGGFTPWERKEEFLKSIGTIFGQKNQLWWDLPAIETFLLNKAIYGTPDEEFKETLQELSKLLDVAHLLRTQVRKLSLGQRMKMEIIAAILHKPKILFLDEPTIGLDVVMQKTIREFIKEYNRRYKATILLTSHYMGEVRELADRVIVIDRGKILFDGELDEIVRQFAKEKIISVVLSKDIDPKGLSEIGEIVDFDFPKAKISVPRDVAPVAASEVLRRFPVADVTIEEMSIEDVIRELFARK